MKYKHVLALNPYYKNATSIMGVFPPTGLEYIATSIKSLVGKITLIDLNYEEHYQDIDILSEFIITKNIDLICISITWNVKFKEVCDFIAKLPNKIPIVIGGHKATEEVELLFNICPNIDVVVRGEGEETIKEIVKGTPLKDIIGLSYTENGVVTHNQDRPLPDISQIDFPDRSLRRHQYHFKQNGVQLSSLTFDTVLSARGCPYNCKFCTFSLNPIGQKRKYAERNVESVIEELKTINADIVIFSDENFFTNPNRSEKLCDLIIENAIKKIFIVQARIEVAANERLLKKAETAGFKIFLIGIESPHDKILKQLNKGFTSKQVRDAFHVLNKYSFYVHAYFIYGNIGETEEEMVYIGQFAKELKLDSISFQKLRIEKYSPMKELVENSPGYFIDSAGGAVYSTQHDLKDLKRIRNRIRSTFYTPSQLLHIVKKLNKILQPTKADILHAILNLPKLLYRVLQAKAAKNANKRRTIIS